MPINILPDMVAISNNSQLTRIVERTISSKLSPRELDEFRQWMQLVKAKLMTNSKSKRFRF